jgi:hypothetical protein
MENSDNKELIDGISALLKGHEEPYEIGSWENFSGHKRNKKPKMLAWLSIAAALAVIFSVVPFLLKDKKDATIIVKQKSTAKDPKIEEQPYTTPPQTGQVAILKQIKKNNGVKHDNPSSQTTKDTTIMAAAISNGEIATVIKEEVQTPVNPLKQVTVQEENFLEFLKKETRNTNVVKTRVPSKWNFGIELSPTVLQSKVNMGAGITTEYKLSESFSLSSGIAYVALDASTNVNQQPVSLRSNKKLVSIDANITAIDIPLSLTYNLNKKVYTSVGVSYFNVLDEKRNNEFLTDLPVSSTLQNIETGKIETFKTSLTERNIETSSELPLKGNSYLGFFNFSIGHKQAVFQHYNIVIEPFLKIPVGKLSNEDLKLSNGGVKLRFTF